MKPLLKSNSLNKKKFKFSNSLGILVVIILFALLIQTRSAEFISRDNFITLMRNSSIIIIVGFGQMVVMAGSGKTTLAKMLLGLISCTEGEIHFQGKLRDIRSQKKKQEPLQLRK